MKKQIIITTILLIATVVITFFYFKNLNPPGTRTNRVMNAIPGTAALIFEFNNDKGFYDIFTNSELLASVIGKRQIGEFDTLRQQLLQNPLLEPYFTGQNIFISVHPSKTNNLNFLLTISAAAGYEPSVIEALSKQPNSGLLITPLHPGGKQGYTIYINKLKKRFYVVNKGDNIFLGSFTKDLVEETAVYKSTKGKRSFIQLSEEQNANSLANLYINYAQLNPLFDLLFKNKNTDVFKSFRLLPGLAALSLNYETDALMFNGSTGIQLKEARSYLNLFTDQQPVENHLKDIFPSTTAYSTNFSFSDPLRFGVDLSRWYAQAGLSNEKDMLFNKIKAETGINIQSEFDKLLANEFAVVTTRYFEKFAIVSVNDGSRLNLLLTALSNMKDENSGQLNYDKLPFFLLGDAFNIFRHPYYLIIDNYLILANSAKELASYNDSYLNRKFLSKNVQYNQFNNLLAAKSNVAFFLNFKNCEPIFKRDMDTAAFDLLQNNEPGWKNFYGASLQLTAADKNFYTNFCLRLNTDTAAIKN